MIKVTALLKEARESRITMVEDNVSVVHIAQVQNKIDLYEKAVGKLNERVKELEGEIKQIHQDQAGIDV